MRSASQRFLPSKTTGRRITVRSRSRFKNLNSFHSVMSATPSVPVAAAYGESAYSTTVGLQRSDLVGDVVDADSFVAEIGEDRTGHEPHVAGTNHADVHAFPMIAESPVRSFRGRPDVFLLRFDGNPAEEDDREGH